MGVELDEIFWGWGIRLLKMSNSPPPPPLGTNTDWCMMRVDEIDNDPCDHVKYVQTELLLMDLSVLEQ